MTKISNGRKFLFLLAFFPVVPAAISGGRVPTPVGLKDDHKTLAIGAPAPDFHLQGVDGKMHSLKSFEKAKIFVSAEKAVWIQKAAVNWANEPVKQDTIGLKGIGGLVKSPTEKLRLINVWATGCVPFVQEFPVMNRQIL
ncbi:MAG: hypothetical protein Q8918_01270 [Bacteroidota bacterium]|nr:hypothetical protein [Bacteroidota bacterium]MDP4211203.1 hypothetical protein [Bacteroidota bacterium]MDP4248718.1 hypothetical protein [Bacteroidota bacterium]